MSVHKFRQYHDLCLDAQRVRGSMGSMETATTKRRRKARRRRFGRCYPRPGGPGFLVQIVDPSGAKTATGRTRYITKSVASREEGERLLKEIEKEILLGGKPPAPDAEPACDLTLVQAVDEYIDRKRAAGGSERGVQRYVTSRAAIAASPLAHRPVATLRRADLETYAAWRRRHKWQPVRRPGARRTDANEIRPVKGGVVSAGSINRDTSLVAAALNRLVHLGRIASNPAARLRRAKEPVRTRAVLSPSEAARLVGCANHHLRPFLLAALLTGQRPDELRALRWGDVSFDSGTITVFRSKVQAGGTVPMHPRLAAELRAMKGRRSESRRVPDDELVFLPTRGGTLYDHRNAWRKAVAGAGLAERRGLSLYSCRHTFATLFLGEGSPSDLPALLGHASYATTERYVRAVGERARRGIEALDFAVATLAE